MDENWRKRSKQRSMDGKGTKRGTQRSARGEALLNQEINEYGNS